MRGGLCCLSIGEERSPPLSSNKLSSNSVALLVDFRTDPVGEFGLSSEYGLAHNSAIYALASSDVLSGEQGMILGAGLFSVGTDVRLLLGSTPPIEASAICLVRFGKTISLWTPIGDTTGLRGTWAKSCNP